MDSSMKSFRDLEVWQQSMTQLEIAQSVVALDNDDHQKIQTSLVKVRMLLYGLTRSLRTKSTSVAAAVPHRGSPPTTSPPRKTDNRPRTTDNRPPATDNRPRTTDP